MSFVKPRGARRRLGITLLVFCAIIALYPQADLFSSLTSQPEAKRVPSDPPSFQKITQYTRFASQSAFRADPTATHKYLPNGHLRVNPDAPHPILELIKDAEEKWRNKRARASKTLDEAVHEYKRRYKRLPPKGFDDWWKYAQENDVQLPDEYDFIYNNLEPFWGVSPEDLLKIQAEQEEIPDSYTLSRNETHYTDLARAAFSTPDKWRERNLLRGLSEILGLLEPVEHILPPFRAIFTPHDNPNLLSDYNVKQAYLDAAREGRYVDVNRLPRVNHYGFASSCPPGSPARVTEQPINQKVRPDPRPGKYFIHDHRRSMDPCSNPYIFYNHAQYVAHDIGPPPKQKLAAQFSFCSTPVYHDLQPPTFIAWTDDVTPRENDPPWEEKTDERLMWRGSNTGIHHSADTRWRYGQRANLVRMTNELNGTETVLFPHAPNADTLRSGESFDGQDEWKVGPGIEMRKSVINTAMVDIAFTGKPLACDPQSYCDYLESLFEWRRKQPPNSKEAGNHKYLVDVDGNGWSSRFKRLITTNSMVFKATAYPEWWIDRIQPWVHYVPVQIDYSDLYDAYVFFRGGVYGEGNHDELARRIAVSGREWSKTFWRREDMTAYFFRLMLEYARIMSLDRESMSFNG